MLHVLSLFVLSTEQLGLLSRSLYIVWIIVHKQCSNDQPTVEDVLFERSPKNIKNTELHTRDMERKHREQRWQKYSL